MTADEKRDRRVGLAEELRVYESALEQAKSAYNEPTVTILLHIQKDYSRQEKNMNISEIVTWDRKAIISGLEAVVQKKTEELKGLL